MSTQDISISLDDAAAESITGGAGRRAARQTRIGRHLTPDPANPVGLHLGQDADYPNADGGDQDC